MGLSRAPATNPLAGTFDNLMARKLAASPAGPSAAFEVGPAAHRGQARGSSARRGLTMRRNRSERIPSTSSASQADAHAVFAVCAATTFLQAQCLACRTTGDVDLRPLDWQRGAVVMALIPARSCRSCRRNAPFAELVCLSKSGVVEVSKERQHVSLRVNRDQGGGSGQTPNGNAEGFALCGGVGCNAREHVEVGQPILAHRVA